VVVLDAGMTELIRPMLYGAEHPVVALTSLGVPVGGAGSGAAPDWGAPLDPGAVPAVHPRPPASPTGPATTPARLDGPVCESTDTFGTVDLPPLRRGDLVAIGWAGAYAASMAMTYNGRPAVPQVLLEADGSLTLGRRRGRAPTRVR
jgi:diaminopimelate decarboxylase